MKKYQKWLLAIVALAILGRVFSPKNSAPMPDKNDKDYDYYMTIITNLEAQNLDICDLAKESAALEKKAAEQADLKYPNAGTVEVIRERSEFYEELSEKYNTEFQEKYGLEMMEHASIDLFALKYCPK